MQKLPSDLLTHKHIGMCDATVNLRGTYVEVSTPTQRSLCFSLWLMYCRILRRQSGKVRSERAGYKGQKTKQAHAPVQN